MDSEYVLDFVLPCGPTGPGASSNVCFVDFNDGMQAGILTVKRSYIFPSSSSFYTVSASAIKVKKGIYEITFCGDLSVTNDASRVVVDIIKNGYGDYYKICQSINLNLSPI